MSRKILLEVKNLGISFGGLRAVDNFSLKIEKVSFMDLLDQMVQVKPLFSTSLRVFINQQMVLLCLMVKNLLENLLLI